MFGFLSAKGIRDEARAIILKFAETSPPSRNGPNGIFSEEQLNRSLELLYSQVASYALGQRLGIIGRARFAKALQDELLLRGYPAEIASKVVSSATISSLVVPDRS